MSAYRSESRIFGEEKLLGEWGDGPTANRLNAVALLADVIERTSGDRLLVDAVAAIRSSPSQSQQLLATAHATYRTARAIAPLQPVRALELYAATAGVFESVKSPFASLARIRMAGCAQREMKLNEALRLISQAEPLHSQVSRQYFGMAAHTEWTRASIYIDQGMPDLAFKSFKRAQSWFHRLGETRNEGPVHARAAQAAAIMGDRDGALHHRLQALRLHSQTPPASRQSILLEAGLGFSSAGYSQLPVSLFDQLISTSRKERDPYYACAGLLWRGLHYATYGQPDRAQRDYNEATAHCSSVEDPAVRARVQETSAVVAGLITAEAPVAVKNLDAAIDVAERTGSRFRRAVLYARRSGRQLEQGNIDEARADSIRAMEDFANQLQKVTESDVRASWLDASRELISSRVDAEIAASNAPAAFGAIEWWRVSSSTRTSLNRTEATIPTIQAIREVLAPDAALVSFYTGEERLTTFVVRASGYTVHSSSEPRIALERAVDQLHRAIQMEDTAVIDAQAMALYTKLFKPLQSDLSEISRLVIVPDGRLNGLPFAMLRDGVNGNRLLDAFTISTLPSAADVLSARACEVRAPFRNVSIVAGARQARPNELILSDPTAEIQGIASLYSSVQILRDNTATP
ncbi:MAG TPA: CHAT domain-containing protein, partial [Thermoanaerobaculia bacterium]